MNLEPLNVKFTSDTTGFSRGLKSVSSGIKGLVKTAALIGGVTLGVKSLTDSFKAFTALESNMNRVGDIFGSASKNIQAFAQGSAKALGLSESVAYEYASTYGNLFKNITSGVTENSAVTIKMLQASAVIASKTGRTMEDVNSRIRSGLLGSTEAIEDLGINVNVSMLEMTDAFKRIAKGRSWEKLTFYEQQQIRTLGILEQAHKNFGDEVQGGTTFSLATLSSSFKDLSATAGSFINVALKPIIQALTVIVQTATQALKGLAALLGINATISASNTDSLSAGGDAAESMAAGLTDSEKAAKKLNKELAGFDQFNDITKSAASGGSASAGPANGAAGGLGLEMEFEELKPPDTSWAEKLTEALRPLKSALDGLWDTLQMVGGFAWQGLKDFYDGFLVPVGSWVLGEGLPRLVSALDKGLQAVNWSKINGALRDLWSALAPFAVNVGEGLLWLWENVLVPFGTWTMNNIVPLFIEAVAAALDIFNNIWDAVKPGLQWLWENFLLPVAQWTGGVIVDVLSAIVDKLKDFSSWCGEHKKTIENIATAVGTFIATWTAVNLVAKIAGIVTALSGFIASGGLATVVAGGLSAAMAFLAANPVVLVAAAIAALVTGIVLLIKNWDEVKEVASNVWAKIKEVWGAVATWFNDTVVSPIANFFGGLWDGIKNGAGMLADFIQEQVIDPIVGAFKGMYNSVVGIIEGVINGFIGIINSFIAGINKVIDKINDIPGVKLSNIPSMNTVSIPRLAQGGLAYGEVQAIVGDNRNVRQDPEVISPLSKLQDMITAAVLQRDISGGGSGNQFELLLRLEDGTPLVEALIDPMNRTAKNLGYNPVFRAEFA